MKRAYETNMELQNLLVEINGSRFAHNVSLSDVNRSVIKSIIMMCSKSDTDKGLVLEFKKLIKYFGAALKNYIKATNEMNESLKTLQVS